MHEVNRRPDPIAHHEMVETVGEAVALLAELGPAARLIAGGTDLLIELANRAHPLVTTLVDLSAVDGLGEIEDLGDEVRLGALVTHNQVVGSDLCAEALTPLWQACREIAAPPLRNRATVVGNVVTASPANDTIGPLRALGAWLVIEGPEGRRNVSLAEFHTGVRQTTLGRAEVVTHLVVPKLGPRRQAVFVKAGLRSAQAISVVNATVLLERSGDVTSDVQILLGSVAPTIVHATGAEDHLSGASVTDGAIEAAAVLAAEGISPIDDIRASSGHRRHLVRIVVERALRALADHTLPLPDRPLLLSPSGTTHGSGQPVTTLNRTPVDLTYADGELLLDWIRAHGEMTGVKEGCGEGECGACVVLVDGSAVLSCLTPAKAATGRAITTIEGLAGDDSLHPLQQGFIDDAAVQCGFCIPGFLLSGSALLAERPDASEEAIVEALGGNLCRCTGYAKILDAFRTAQGMIR